MIIPVNFRPAQKEVTKREFYTVFDFWLECWNAAYPEVKWSATLYKFPQRAKENSNG